MKCCVQTQIGLYSFKSSLVCYFPEFHIGELSDGDENGDADDTAGGGGGDAEVLVQIRVVTEDLYLSYFQWSNQRVTRGFLEVPKIILLLK